MSQLDPSVLASLASLAQRRSMQGRGLSRRQVQQVVEKAIGDIDNGPPRVVQHFQAFVPGEAEAKFNITHLTAITGVPILLPFNVAGMLSAARMQWQMSRVTNGSNALSVSLGLYSFVNSTKISLIGSNSHAFSNTATASVSGVRIFEAPMGSNFSRITAGDYVLALVFNATASASANYSLMGGNTSAPPLQTRVAAGSDQYVTATSVPLIPFWGRYSTTTASMPLAIEASQAIVNGTGASQPLPIWIALAAST